MALAKDRMHPSSFMLDGGSSSTPPSPLQFLNLSSLNASSTFYLFEDDHYPKQNGDDGDSSSDKDTNTAGKSPSTPLSSSSSANHSAGFIGGAAHGSCYGGGVDFMDTSSASLLSFQPIGCSDDFGGVEFISSGYQETTSDWWYGDGSVAADSALDSATQPQRQQQQQQTSFKHKRTLMEEDNVQTLKKQCTSNGSSKKQANKPKSSTKTSKDPQSIAAKHRRERISERLKVLQDLVPNGCKVDMVTMLDKAISYVKFLQLQVKVLATDEFWPSEGGKPPNTSQVKEAIDAILSSSQGDTPSNTSSDTYL